MSRFVQAFSLRDGFVLGAADIARYARDVADTVVATGAELPFAKEALTELESKIEQASVAHDAAQEARVALQTKQRELRAQAAVAQRGLVMLRRTLRAALGSRISTARECASGVARRRGASRRNDA